MIIVKKVILLEAIQNRSGLNIEVLLYLHMYIALRHFSISKPTPQNNKYRISSSFRDP
jgi:hypothetical protein